MDNTYLVVVSVNTDNQPATEKTKLTVNKGQQLFAALKQLGNVFPVFTNLGIIAASIKTDEHARIVLKHIQRHAIDHTDQAQILQLADDHAMHGHSQLALWL